MYKYGNCMIWDSKETKGVTPEMTTWHGTEGILKAEIKR